MRDKNCWNCLHNQIEADNYSYCNHLELTNWNDFSSIKLHRQINLWCMRASAENGSMPPQETKPCPGFERKNEG